MDADEGLTVPDLAKLASVGDLENINLLDYNLEFVSNFSLCSILNVYYMVHGLFSGK